MLNARSYICFVVNTLNQFMVESRRVHWVVVKHVLKYLRDTMEYRLRYVRVGGVEFKAYTDSN